MAAACLTGQPRGEADRSAAGLGTCRPSLDTAGRDSQGPSAQRAAGPSMAPQQACPCSSDTSNQRLDLTKGSIKRIKESSLASSQHSSSCPSLPTLAQPTAVPVPGPSAFASHSRHCMTAPIGPTEAAEASDVEPTQDVHPVLSLSRAYTAPAAIGPTSSSRASLFPAPRACPTGLDRFGSFAAMLVFGHHHPDELAAVAAGRDDPEHSASHLETAASDIYDHLVVQQNSWLSLDSLAGDDDDDNASEQEECDSDASLHYMAEEVAAGVKAGCLPHHLGHLGHQRRLEPWSSDTSLAGSCCGDIAHEPSSGLGSSSACSSSYRGACGLSPDASASSWRLGSCQPEDSSLSEEPSLPELPGSSAYLTPGFPAPPSVGPPHKRLLLQKPPAGRHGPSGLGLSRPVSPPEAALAASWLDRAALQLKALLVCGAPQAGDLPHQA